jgi:hypothetical protein
LLARTDLGAPKHKGLTMFLVPLRVPVSRSRRYTLGGERTNMVFFDKCVRFAPHGPENQGGWCSTPHSTSSTDGRRRPSRWRSSWCVRTAIGPLIDALAPQRLGAEPDPTARPIDDPDVRRLAESSSISPWRA